MKIEINYNAAIKSYNRYTYDEILDKYNETEDKRLLDFLLFKKNKWTTLDIKAYYETTMERTILYLFNIQQFMDNKKEALYFNDIYNVVDKELNEDKDDDDDDIIDII